MKTTIKSNNDILFRNFDVFSQSERSVNNFKPLVFQLALKGKLDFKKLSNGRLKKPLQTLIKEQKQYLKKEGIDFEEKSNSVWPIVKLGTICEFNPKKSKVKDLPKNQLVSFVPMTDLNAHNINFRIKHEKKLKDVYSGYTYFAEGDVLLARVTPCFENGKSGIAKNLKNGVGFGSSEFFVYRVNKKNILSEIIYYFISSNTFIDNGKENMSGTGGLQRLTKDYAIRYKIPLPPLEVQKEIVSLMEKCALLEIQIKEKSQKQEEFSKSSMYFITQSKNKKERAYYWEMLKHNFKDALYSKGGTKEFKAMIFQLCLTGKLDFQKLSAGQIKKLLQTLIKEQKQYLKKEGIPFEEKPESIWPVVVLGKICDVEYGFTDSAKNNGDTRFIRITDIDQQGDITETDKKFINISKQSQKYILKKNNILITRTGATFGKTTLFNKKYNAVFASYLIRLIFKKNSNLSPYYYLVFSQSKHYWNQAHNLVTGGAQPQFNGNVIKQIKIPLPPLEIQKEIVSLMKYIESIEKQIYKEKNIGIKLSQALSHLENYQKVKVI